MKGFVAIAVDEDPDHEAKETMNLELYTYAKKDRINELTDYHSLQQYQSKEHAPLSTIFDAVTPSGNSLLHVAASYESENVTRYVARELTSLITRENYQGDTALHLAARNRKLSTVKILVQADASLLKMTNKKGNTPLHEAVINGDYDVAEHLVGEDREVAYNYYNKAGKSPLYLAVKNGGGIDILDLLLDAIQYGNSNYPKREDGDSHSKLQPEVKSPVYAAIELHSEAKLQKLATKFPALLHYKDKELRNPLHYASSLGYIEGVKFLLEKYKAGATERDKQGNLPIHIASKHGHVKVVEVLLEQWPDKMEFLNGKEQNILHVAAEHGQEKVVQYILTNISEENGNSSSKLPNALLNETDEDGNTPLHLAAKHGKSFAVFGLIRDKRVDKEIVNNENLTSYNVAENQSKAAVMEYEKSDKMLAKEHQCDTDNVAMVDLKEDKLADAKKQHETADSNGCKRLDFYQVKQDVKTKIEFLLLVAVFVAGVTFAGATQLPKLAEKGSSSEFQRSIHVGPLLLNLYIIVDIWSLNSSVVAAIILLWTQLNDLKFAPYALWISSNLVGGSIFTSSSKGYKTYEISRTSHDSFREFITSCGGKDVLENLAREFPAIITKQNFINDTVVLEHHGNSHPH
ncbi:unnamed protein product [Dovyalis caffra]|uniref:PGG domain-containing protein n=1 Tax=Dovyalis caffra TaxID=77055 RepID=A0AAV1SEN7_9ROSI|nr:unnamed protein product [Dovyalis caffra]